MPECSEPRSDNSPTGLSDSIRQYSDSPTVVRQSFRQWIPTVTPWHHDPALSAASPTVRQSVRQSDSTLRHHFQPLKLLPDTGKYPLFCSVTLQDLAASTGFHSSISSRPMVANDRPTVVRQSSDSVRQSSDSVRQCPTVRDDGATSDSPTVSDSVRQ